jgi:hypothetical protein
MNEVSLRRSNNRERWREVKQKKRLGKPQKKTKKTPHQWPGH